MRALGRTEQDRTEQDERQVKCFAYFNKPFKLIIVSYKSFGQPTSTATATPTTLTRSEMTFATTPKVN